MYIWKIKPLFSLSILICFYQTYKCVRSFWLNLYNYGNATSKKFELNKKKCPVEVDFFFSTILYLMILTLSILMRRVKR